jgi:ribosomal protein S18 acetylase RimI-like enzyme
MDFPTAFASETLPLDTSLFNKTDVELIERLAEKGYEIHTGLTPAYADDIAQMCLQPSIKEYCPNDYGKRFANLDATEQWLAKGRLTFLLLKKQGEEYSLTGYGWSGLETSEHAPGGESTFALRIGEAGQGQGLATPFARLIVAGTAAIYDVKNMWLETWASNGGAVHIYHKLGFKDVAQVDGIRPTADGRTVKDTRLYMTLSNDLL